MLSFWMAVQFLTRLPTPEIGILPDEKAAQAFWYYPLVGLLLGTFLSSAYLFFEWLIGWDLALTQAWVVAAIVLSLWVYLSGGLHLDGLADSADGWMSCAPPERTLEIMRDSNSGAGAVIFVPLLLLLKFSALVHLLSYQMIWPLLVAPMLGRAVIIPLVLMTPCARAEGMGFKLKQLLEPKIHIGISLAVVLVSVLLAGFSSLPVLLLCTAVFFAVRHCMMQRLGGYTGDTLGASTELIEATVLLTAVFCL